MSEVSTKGERSRRKLPNICDRPRNLEKSMWNRWPWKKGWISIKVGLEYTNKEQDMEKTYRYQDMAQSIKLEKKQNLPQHKKLTWSKLLGTIIYQFFWPWCYHYVDHICQWHKLRHSSQRKMRWSYSLLLHILSQLDCVWVTTSLAAHPWTTLRKTSEDFMLLLFLL